MMASGLLVVRSVTRTAMRSLFWAGTANLVTLANCPFSGLTIASHLLSAIDAFTFRLVYGLLQLNIDVFVTDCECDNCRQATH
jgi:hypothetical protein